MNPLPSMIALDFCEWLKKVEIYNKNESCADVLELIFNEQYSYRLEKLAKEYLGGIDYSMRKTIHRFIDSKEFEQCCLVYHDMDFGDEYRKGRLSRSEYRHFLHRCCYSSDIADAWCRFVCNDSKSSPQYIYEATPEMLVDSVKYYIRYQKDEPIVVDLIASLSANLSLEIDFLEWIMISKDKRVDLDEMPLAVFESIVDEYCEDTNHLIVDKQKLVKAFKQGNNILLREKLLSILSPTKIKKMRSLGLIYDRFSNEKIPFRCFFLPLASEGDRFENFIKKNWIDLHAMSSDCLDIYYSEDDYGKSGYAIKNGMKMAPNALSEILPCLVIWQNDLSLAQAIDIGGLSDKEIVRLIAKIVEMIKMQKELSAILLETENMVTKMNDLKRPIGNTTVNIDTNNGVVAGRDISKSKINVYTRAVANVAFDTECEKALDIINSFSSVQQEYRDVLISLVKEANLATQTNNDEEKNLCKSKFEGFILGAGKTVGMIVTKLSELATIASFFGI